MSSRKRVCVVVLGDFGHSPRMQSHALSLASNNFFVDVVAQLESLPHNRIRGNENIKIHPMPSYGDKKFTFLPSVLNYALKVIFQAFVLFWTLLWLPRSSHILVQNPPSVPALPVVWLICLIKRAVFVIDWHNYGWTILNLNMPPKPDGKLSLLVLLYHKMEFYFGAKSKHDLCVSRAMSNDLVNLIGKQPLVLYDKPYTFHELSCEEKHDLWSKFKLSSSIFGDEEDESRTVFTEIIDGEAQLRADRPVLIVSSTSWTKDEDFQILLDALYLLDTQHARDTIRNGQDLKVICVITGKGPMKQYYTDKLKTLSFVHTKFIFPWLVAEDYPKLLACADVGVSLHKSSSGVDLPMKVVDMFGCGLPVCAYSYRCIGELVHNNTNGLLFEDHLQLTECLRLMLANYPSSALLNQLRRNIVSDATRIDWATNWNNIARPLFTPNDY